MSNNKFNAKYAAGFDDEYPEDALEGLFGGDGYHIVEEQDENPFSSGSSETYGIPEYERSSESSSDFAPGSDEPVKKEPGDDSGFGPLRTLSPKPLNRPLLAPQETVVKRFWGRGAPQTEVRRTGEYSEEQYEHNPEKWVARVKDMAADSLANRILRPVAYEARQQRKNYDFQNRRNRNEMSATYRLIPEILRASEAYRCRECNGEGCAFDKDYLRKGKCNGSGHTLTDPQYSLTDITRSAAAENNDIDFHKQVCFGQECHPRCNLKGKVDELIRIPHNERSSTRIKKGEVVGRPSGNGFFDNLMRFRAVRDNYRSIAPALSALGTKKADEPLKKYTVCHFINFDTENPDGNLSERLSPDAYHDNEHVYNAGGGGRDKQMFAVITKTHANGTHDIIYSARPIDAIRKERNERTKGRKGSRDQWFYGPNEGMSAVTAQSAQHAGVRDHIINAFHNISSYFGERSPLNGSQSKRYYKVLKNVPANFLAPVDDTVASMITFSGTHKETHERNKLTGWKRIKQFARGSMTTVNMKDRIGTGFSNEELNQAFDTIGDENTLNELRGLRKDIKRDLGLDRSLYDSDAEFERHSKMYDIGYGRNEADDEVVNPVTNNYGLNTEDLFGPLPTQTPKPVPGKQHNSAESAPSGFEPEIAGHIPMPEQPPHVDQLASTPEGRQETVRLAEQVTGRKMDPEQQNRFFDGMKEGGSTSAGLDAIDWGDPAEKITGE